MSEQKTETRIMDTEAVVVTSQEKLDLIMRAEIDTQIATAHAFPRSIDHFMKRVLSLATINEDVAQSCAYALPRGRNKDGTDKILEGPSVRLAEIVASQYGNLRAGMRVISNDGRTITAQGICHDLETNTCITLEVRRSVLQNEYKAGNRTGRMVSMSEDMQVVTGNATCAIAFRNAVFKVVPTVLIADIYEKVKEVARGSAETMPKRRQKALDYLYNLGVKDENICEKLGIKSVNDIDLDKLYILRGMCTLIQNGEATAAELFSPEDKMKDRANAAESEAEKAIKAAAAKASKK